MATETAMRQVSMETGRRLAGAVLLHALERQPDVVAAYVFGSRVRRAHSDRSDLDVALLLEAGMSRGRLFRRRLELMTELDRAGKTSVDVVVLNDAPTLLQHQVLSTGTLCLERDREARIDFEVGAGKLYAESGPARRFFLDALFDELDSGGLGG